MNFQTKKGRYHNWITLNRHNKKLDNEIQLKGYEMRKESRSFLITVKNCTGISLMETSQAT
jgi:hypothetical protein